MDIASACRIVPPGCPALNCVPRPRERICEHFPLRRCSSFQLVSGPSRHRYLPFHFRYPPASVKSAQTRPRRSVVLARVFQPSGRAQSRPAHFKAVGWLCNGPGFKLVLNIYTYIQNKTTVLYKYVTHTHAW